MLSPSGSLYSETRRAQKCGSFHLGVSDKWQSKKRDLESQQGDLKENMNPKCCSLVK